MLTFQRGFRVNNEEKHSQRVAVYAGTFDPLTIGHLDIARRAARLFDTLIVAVYTFPAKNLLFSVDERLTLWQKVVVTEELANIRVEKYTELTTDFVRRMGANTIVKGLRSPGDFEAELQQNFMNRKLAPDIETVCLLTNLEHLFVSSSLIKEVTRLGGNVTEMVPAVVLEALQEKFRVK